MKILVVDDDAIARLIIEQNLKVIPSLNSAISKAENGKVAIEFIEKDSFDVVLLDLNMPIMNGFEVLAYLNEKNYNIPVFVVTSSNLREDKEKCEEYGFVKGVILKPISQKDLIQLENL